MPTAVLAMDEHPPTKQHTAVLADDEFGATENRGKTKAADTATVGMTTYKCIPLLLLHLLHFVFLGDRLNKNQTNRVIDTTDYSVAL